MHLLTAPLILLLAQLTAATDISLSSFTPRIDNLPSACRAVYTTAIDGCVASDFAGGATCSVQCLAGLVRIGVSVKTGCRDVDVGETSIIGVFQNGLGVAALCPNNKQSPSTSPSASTTKTTASSARPTSRSTLESSKQTSTLATTTAAPPSSSAQPSSESSGLAIDTTATQAASTSFKFNDPTAAPSSTAKPSGHSQLSNLDSGGGSPFDVVATGAGGSLHSTRFSLVGVLAAIAVAACL
jgi:hypothetical protein